MLTQRYKKIAITVRDQLKQLFVWFPKNRHELELIIKENDVGSWDVGYIKERLKNEKHACLYTRLEHPRTSSLNKYNKNTMTTKYDPKKDSQESVVDVAWLTGGLAIVNFSLKALRARMIFGNTIENYGKLYGGLVTVDILKDYIKSLRK